MIAMILIVGGQASGKRIYARGLGYTPEQLAVAELDERPVVCEVQSLLRDGELGFAELAEALADKEVVTCCEVGSGVVPIDTGERLWRDEVGKLVKALAEQATCVVRMVCGIPTALKGELPQRGSETGEA